MDCSDTVIDAFDKAGAISTDALWTITGTSVNNPPSGTILAGSSYAADTLLTRTHLFSFPTRRSSDLIDHITLYDSTTTNGAVWRYNGSVITPGGAAAGGFSFAYANRGLVR